MNGLVLSALFFLTLLKPVLKYVFHRAQNICTFSLPVFFAEPRAFAPFEAFNNLFAKFQAFEFSSVYFKEFSSCSENVTQ